MLAGVGTCGGEDGVWYSSDRPKASVHVTTALIMVVKGRKSSTLTNGALIHVLVASASYKASGTGANGTAVKRVGVTHSAFVARVTDTGIIQVAQQTCGETKSEG